MSNLINGNFSSIEQMTNLVLNNKATVQNSTVKENSLSFQEVLDAKQKVAENKELKFSKHANERLASRNIDLSESQLERLENATKKAGEKGITESLIMIDNLAFIVSIKNNTVITAVNDGDDKVFTNIDGAVIV